MTWLIVFAAFGLSAFACFWTAVAVRALAQWTAAWAARRLRSRWHRTAGLLKVARIPAPPPMPRRRDLERALATRNRASRADYRRLIEGATRLCREDAKRTDH